MPCFCWASNEELEPEMSEIREHLKRVVALISILDHKGDFAQTSTSIPRNLLKDCHKLLDDLATGECQER